eukprot:TRINITY_DN1360_c0_g1_i1.p1 TRINITY_DN1360_c0_g1~~TRINITY_DN1360_c0_g1_i1.p1  ORF type:complete len:119 (-),score=23.33 TRINITY_DN1360_c0_g1_i1:128-484(-)
MPLKSQAIFDLMDTTLKSNPSLLKKVNAVYVFNLESDGQTHTYTADAKNEASAGIKKGTPQGKADCTITMSDTDFFDLSTGKLDGMAAFAGGKLKVSGNIMLAQKLSTITQQLGPAKL